MKGKAYFPQGPVLVGEFPPDARETIADLIKERDTAEGAAMYADEERAAAEKECDRIAEERDAAIVERDELKAAALPEWSDVVAGKFPTPPAPKATKHLFGGPPQVLEDSVTAFFAEFAEEHPEYAGWV